MDVWQRRRGLSITSQGVVFLILICIHIKQVLLFNLETRLPIVKVGKPGAYFGFSVAEHQVLDDINGSVDATWLLVGAPLDQNLQPGTNKSGALWKCPMTTRRNDCSQVVTDGKRTIDSRDLMPPGPDEIKDGQWMGVTVRSQKPGGKVLVCAHRYVHSGTDFQWGRGLCYTLTQYLDFDKSFDPCKGRSTKRAHEEFGYCQAGTSGVLTQNDTVVIGSPGPYTWRGTVFVTSVSDDFLFRQKTVYYAPVMESESPVEKYSYLGMSVASGTFYSDKIGYAAGAPRANGTGTVILFPELKEGVNPMQVKSEIHGEQFASSFGYELASADVNGDKRSDLLVGAPFYYGKEAGGAVYVYVNTPEYCLHCNEPVKLTGKPESRFGFAITSLGDLNQDGYDDIAIGAPYEGKGAVYIYLGSDNGLITEPSQVIKSEDLARKSPVTFGYSLSGGVDMDENGYPDLMIGAYDADTVILLRARPIVGIVTKVRPEQNLKNIDPLKHGCSKDPNSNWTCFAFDTCFNIETAGKALTGDQVLRLKYKLEAETFSGRKFSRVWFGRDSELRPHIIENTITWSPGDDFRCSPQIVYIKENTRDIQSPIKFRLVYSLIQEQPRPTVDGEALPSVDRYPILNQQEAVKTFQATFQKDCGDNDICESNLEVKAGLQLPQLSSDQWELMLGENNEVVLNVTVHNYGESAYESQMYVTHPESLSYIGTSTEEKHLTCQPYNKTLVVCNIGNPFKQGSKDLRLRFDPQGLKDKEVQLQFSVFANSTSEETDPQEPVSLSANVVKKAELSIHGKAHPEQVFYGGMVKGESAIKYRDEVGSRVLHTYQVYNGGPWKVNRLEVHIDWPFQIANTKPQGKWLLYMDEKPTVEAVGGGECLMEPGQVNPLQLTTRPGLDEKPLESLIRPEELIDARSDRKKRDTEMILRAEAITDKDGRRKQVVTSNCVQGTAKCFKFVCVIRNLNKNTEATIQIRARLWNSTLVEDYPRIDLVRIGSRARIHLQGIHQKTDDDEAQVESMVYPDLLDQQEPEPVSIWIIIFAIAAGIFLLILLTFCLWKLGFFKRRRPDPTLSGNIEKHHRDEDYN